MVGVISEPVEFRHNIIRTLHASQRRVQQDNGAKLGLQARENALYVLERFAFNYADAWPYARDLVLALAPRLEQTEYRDKWLAILHAGLEGSRIHEDGQTTAQLHFYIGQLYWLSSRHKQAVVHLQQSRALFANHGAAAAEAQSIVYLGYLAIRDEEYDEAAQLANQAIQLVDADSPEHAAGLSVLGFAAQNQGRYQEAVEYHQAAIQIRTAHNLPKEMAWSLQNLGVTLREQGQIDESTVHLRRALHLLDELGDVALKAMVQMNLSGNYQILGEARRALGLLGEAESALNMVLDEYNLAKLLTTKGLCYLSLQRYEQAANAFTMSAELFEKLGNLGWSLNALDGLGITYLERSWYEQALSIFESIEKELPLIHNTAAYRYLVTTVPRQIQQAKEHAAIIGHGAFQYGRISTATDGQENG